ncbi:MAG: POTRA domain-containing protein, partial [Fibrobacter sp.]|nr:POTRA domain-containing protein [Fibrobacter sp.]
MNFDLHGRNGNMKQIRLKLLFGWLMILLKASVMAEIVDSVTVHITEEPYNIEKLYKTAHKLIVVREHQELDSVLLKQSLDALMTCRFFEKAEAEIVGGKLTFKLVPAKYIRDIRIRREIPLFEDDVLNAISIYPGDVFYDGILSGQDSLITLLYEKEGFISSDVKVESKEHRKSRGHIVNVSIRAGKHYRLKDIEINGNRAFGDFKLKLRMKTWQASLAPGSAGRFVKTVFKEDVGRLVEFYKSKRFSDVKIKDSVVIDSSDNWVHVILDIDEGVRYKTGVSGRRDRGSRKSVINKDITVYKTGNKNNVGVRRSVKAIEKRLKRD